MACRHGHELYTDHSFNLILTTAHPCGIHAGGKQLKDIKLQKNQNQEGRKGYYRLFMHIMLGVQMC